MKQFNHCELVLRIVFFLIGLMLFALGIAITIVASYGVSPWDASCIGLHQLFGQSIGTWMNIQAVLLIAMGAAIKRERPKVECMITSIVLSAFVDLFVYLLGDIQITEWYMQALVYIMGAGIVSAGCGTYLIAEFPPCPIDYFMMAIKTGFHTSIRTAMTFCEGTGFLLALAVKGPMGIGTILSVFIYGPMIQFFNHQANRLFYRSKGHLPQVVHNTVDI